MVKMDILGVMSRSSVYSFSELYSLFLKGGNSALIAALASGLFPKKPISITRITTALMV